MSEEDDRRELAAIHSGPYSCLTEEQRNRRKTLMREYDGFCECKWGKDNEDSIVKCELHRKPIQGDSLMMKYHLYVDGIAMARKDSLTECVDSAQVTYQLTHYLWLVFITQSGLDTFLMTGEKWGVYGCVILTV